MTVFLDSSFIWYIGKKYNAGWVGSSLFMVIVLSGYLECIKAVCVYISPLSSVQGASSVNGNMAQAPQVRDQQKQFKFCNLLFLFFLY